MTHFRSLKNPAGASSDRSQIDRRRMLQNAGSGFGLLALEAMLRQEGAFGQEAIAGGQAGQTQAGPVQAGRGQASRGHHAAKAKSVIFLFMGRGPEPHRLVRSEAETSGVSWTAVAIEFQADHYTDGGIQRAVDAQQADLEAVRTEWSLGIGLVTAYCAARG